MQGTTLKICLFLTFFSCSKESQLVDKPLREYLNIFEVEAMKRGIKVDYGKNPVEVRLELHNDSARLGWCNYHSDRPDLIIINAFYWDLLNDLEKEKLVFHELGHCILNRSHLDAIQQDGYCKSIMQSGQRCADNYNIDTRSSYLDELFLRR